MAQQGVLVSYKGETMLTAASSGNLPLCVLLWGMGAAKQLNLLRAVDEQGNTPFHHAVRAQSTDVMAFFNQQSKGMLTPELRLVDAVNTAGETGLQRAAATGCMPVIKALLDEKSDVCHVNNYGQNVLHICVRECQLWTLNYLHNYISDTVGAEKAKEMLHAVDKDGNGLIEYAADAGDVNITEYLVRKGLNPFRVHPDTGSTPLHLAVAHHRMELMSFLLHCGANPHIADKKGVTAFQHHALQQDPVLRAALMSHPRVTSCCTQAKVEYPTFDPEKGE
jgi:ankyrin repeat protein